jgi:hypothetical protein
MNSRAKWKRQGALVWMTPTSSTSIPGTSQDGFAIPHTPDKPTPNLRGTPPTAAMRTPYTETNLTSPPRIRTILLASSLSTDLL